MEKSNIYKTANYSEHEKVKSQLFISLGIHQTEIVSYKSYKQYGQKKHFWEMLEKDTKHVIITECDENTDYSKFYFLLSADNIQVDKKGKYPFYIKPKFYFIAIADNFPNYFSFRQRFRIV